jgi:NAD(P)-dependent dehydrogenase (short-subunit alcohol dehydrogenase family)
MGILDGKVAVVTGGNSGIGLATAKLFHKEGAKVAISGRDPQTLASAAVEIGEGTLAVTGDLRSLSSIENLFSTTFSKLGKVDILFVNAGVGKFASIAETSEEQFDELFAINVKGAFFTLQKALPHLNDGAAIVFNTTYIKDKGAPGASVYGATKAALRTFVRVAAAELVGRGIRVNAVSPGPIVTPIFGRLGLPQEVSEQMAASIVAQVPMKRMGQAAEVANAVLFLASAASSYITGVEIEVGGGVGQV